MCKDHDVWRSTCLKRWVGTRNKEWEQGRGGFQDGGWELEMRGMRMGRSNGGFDRWVNLVKA